MIPRLLTDYLLHVAKHYPVITLTGPRQSGKTTLVRDVFKEFAYASLELPDERRYAQEDPVGFFSRFEGPVILDEVQQVPDLFSYIQVLVDERRARSVQFVLTGSQDFLLLDRISQSLAGRAAVVHLLPLSLAEIMLRKDPDPEDFGGPLSHVPETSPGDLFNVLFRGFYPRIHDVDPDPMEWYANYYETYIQRDVRTVTNVGDLQTFDRFVRMCAGRTAQVLNLSGLASDCGISHDTARRWLSVLEASFIVRLLPPHFKNFGKRLIKSPKLHFLDTGLLCYLLGIRRAEELHHHANRGTIFESFIFSELNKILQHRGRRPPIFFWRDNHGHEMDFVLERSDGLIGWEVKSGRTMSSESLDGLQYWRRIAGEDCRSTCLVYGGDQFMHRQGAVVYPWYFI